MTSLSIQSEHLIKPGTMTDTQSLNMTEPENKKTFISEFSGNLNLFSQSVSTHDDSTSISSLQSEFSQIITTQLSAHYGLSWAALLPNETRPIPAFNPTYSDTFLGALSDSYQYLKSMMTQTLPQMNHRLSSFISDCDTASHLLLNRPHFTPSAPTLEELLFLPDGSVALSSILHQVVLSTINKYGGDYSISCPVLRTEFTQGDTMALLVDGSRYSSLSEYLLNPDAPFTLFDPAAAELLLAKGDPHPLTREPFDTIISVKLDNLSGPIVQEAPSCTQHNTVDQINVLKSRFLGAQSSYEVLSHELFPYLLQIEEILSYLFPDNFVPSTEMAHISAQDTQQRLEAAVELKTALNYEQTPIYNDLFLPIATSERVNAIHLLPSSTQQTHSQLTQVAALRPTFEHLYILEDQLQLLRLRQPELSDVSAELETSLHSSAVYIRQLELELSQLMDRLHHLLSLVDPDTFTSRLIDECDREIAALKQALCSGSH